MKHILIVDDEADIREMLTEVLTRKNYRVSSVATASEAQRIADRDHPQLIISDLQLEDLDGLEMIDQLKATHPDTPVILLTGVLFDPHVIRTTLNRKVSAYLEKTAPLSQIIGEVERLIGRQAPPEAATA
jgi:DNA-binding NtrC family response regulator